MSELKAKHVVDVYDAYSANPYNESQVYLKSEADKVIADLEESHKKEVGQLLIEIAELKAKADKLHSCLKCLVMRDLIKDCPEKKSAIEIVKEAK